MDRTRRSSGQAPKTDPENSREALGAWRQGVFFADFLRRGKDNTQPRPVAHRAIRNARRKAKQPLGLGMETMGRDQY
jgi:hypothetical protein